MKKTAESKTFYSVRFNGAGMREPEEAWFATKEEAMKFYWEAEAADRPVRHTFRKADSIAEAEEKILAREAEEKAWEEERKYWDEMCEGNSVLW